MSATRQRWMVAGGLLLVALAYWAITGYSGHERLATMSNGGQQRLHKLATDRQEIAIMGEMRRVDPTPIELGCDESRIRVRIGNLRYPFRIGKLGKA